MLDKDRLERLFARHAFGIKPGLDATRLLLAELGSPHNGLAVVHIAGTNGKGSVAAMLASIFQTAGFKTALYTSPHLARLNERFQLDGAEIPDAELEPLLAEVERAAEALEQRGAAVPTFFECMTAAAALWYKRKGAQLLVAEVGMGGRLDSTNVLHPVLSVITRIGMDHMEYLGATLEDIAREKAGIIKPAVPLVCGATPPAALAVIRAAAAAQRTPPLLFAPDEVSVLRKSGDLAGQRVAIESQSQSYGAVSMKLAASYQTENIATAVAAAEAFQRAAGIDFGADIIKRGLAATRWTGRFQLISETPQILIDGAHNPDGAAALVKALHDAKAGRRLPFITGMCADKDIDGFFATISATCGRVRTVPLQNPRGAPPLQLAETAKRHGIKTAIPFATLSAALEDAKAEATSEGKPLIICGSLFLVGEILAMENAT